MDIGDLFLLRDRTISDHPFVIISDPDKDPDCVVMVMLTSYDEPHHKQHKDPSCILRVGDHPWIRHDTCVSYRDGRTATAEHLTRFTEEGALELQEPINEDVLGRILAGAEQTDELPGKCRRILERQGLIES